MLLSLSGSKRRTRWQALAPDVPRGRGMDGCPRGWTAVGCSCAMSNHGSSACAGMLQLPHGSHLYLSRVRACLAGAPRTPSHLVHAVRWRRKTRLCGSSASAVASSRLCLPRLWLAAVDQLHSSERLWYTAPAMHAATVSRLWCTPHTFCPTPVLRKSIELFGLSYLDT